MEGFASRKGDGVGPLIVRSATLAVGVRGGGRAPQRPGDFLAPFKFHRHGTTHRPSLEPFRNGGIDRLNWSARTVVASCGNVDAGLVEILVTENGDDTVDVIDIAERNAGQPGAHREGAAVGGLGGVNTPFLRVTMV